MVSPSNSSLKRKKLTPKQAKFVKGVTEGKTKVAAAMEAYPNATYETARVIAAENISKPSIASALEAAYERQGITVDAIVKPIADGLVANRVVQLEGDFYETEVPDHATRIKAAGMAAQWVGIGKEVAVSGGVHFHQHSNAKQSKYED